MQKPDGCKYLDILLAACEYLLNHEKSKQNGDPEIRKQMSFEDENDALYALYKCTAYCLRCEAEAQMNPVMQMLQALGLDPAKVKVINMNESPELPKGNA